MNYGTFCSGIEAPSVACHPIGWKPVFFSEISPFPSAVLKQRWPDVPNIGDMNRAHDNPIFKNVSVDLVLAGTPCQSFSIAGLRAGLDSPNGNLALQFLRLLDQKRPRWMVWENVPGVFSSWTDAEVSASGCGPGKRDVWQTNDFETFVAGLAEIGYSCAWRVLDAQSFGVPQRRERVFVVGYYGTDWRRPAAVLFDPDCLSRHPTKGNKKGQSVTGTLTARAGGGGNIGNHFDINGGFQPVEITGAMTKKWAKGTGGPSGDECQNLVVFNNKAAASQSMNPGEISPALDVGKSGGLTVFDMRHGGASNDVTMTLMAGQPGQGYSQNNLPHTLNTKGVRRMTPMECERLQGFPDGYTDIIYRNKPAKDGPRYECLGNSMAVPVLNWIGNKIKLVDGIK